MVPNFFKKNSPKFGFFKILPYFFPENTVPEQYRIIPDFPRKIREKIWTTESVFLARSSGCSHPKELGMSKTRTKTKKLKIKHTKIKL